MADRPILFSAPMVRALLDGRKTQTRRALKPQPNMLNGGHPLYDGHGRYSIDGGWKNLRYGIGDRLWVRESGIQLGNAVDEGRDRDGYEICGFHYSADDAYRYLPGMYEGHDYERRRNSIHMPRWASRLTLTVTDVRVQRLCDISEANAIAEGCEASGWRPSYSNTDNSGGDESCSATQAYLALWNSINGADADFANPWVIALTFNVRHGNIDAMAQIGGEARAPPEPN